VLALHVQRMLDAAPVEPEAQERWLSAVARASFAAVIGQAPVLATLALGSIDDAIEARRGTVLGPLVRAHIAHARAAEAMLRRDRQTAAERYADAAEAFREAGALRQEAGARANVAAMYLELGDHGRAEPVITQAISTAEQARAPYALHLARFNRGLVAAAAQDWRPAETLIRESLEAFVAQGDRRLQASAHCAFAELRLAQGDLTSARAEAEAARAAAQGLGGSEAGACAVLSLVLWQAGERDAAAHWAREGMRLREQQPLEERDELLRLMYAAALERAGDTAGAGALRAELESDLQACAALIRDPSLREAYVTRARAQSAGMRA
jgi:tetratricopeptide (TPR) repeat protein